MSTKKTLRLILGDQLNSQHSWYKKVDENITYVLMELRSETDYATHHIQKIVGFFAAMQTFSQELQIKDHKVIYIKLNDLKNLQSFNENLDYLIKAQHFTHFEYQFPDEYRLDVLLKEYCKSITITSQPSALAK